MDFASFEASLSQPVPPAGLSRPLKALWQLGRGAWDEAHRIAQEDEADPTCAWVHAHLHRVEGDLQNARYWYRRAGRPAAERDHGAEWRAIVSELLRHG